MTYLDEKSKRTEVPQQEKISYKLKKRKRDAPCVTTKNTKVTRVKDRATPVIKENDSRNSPLTCCEKSEKNQLR